MCTLLPCEQSNKAQADLQEGLQAAESEDIVHTAMYPNLKVRLIEQANHLLSQIWVVLVRRIFFCSCNSPYNRPSAVGGQPGT